MAQGDPQLVEKVVDLIKNHLQTNLGTELAVVSSNRDNLVSMETPINESYFIYAPVAGYRKPAILIIAEERDNQLERNGANFVDSIVNMHIACIVEDQDLERLVRKTYRYQAALHKLLFNRGLTSSDNLVKIVVVVNRERFTPEYTNAQAKDNPQGAFCKEVHLECSVKHWEQA